MACKQLAVATAALAALVAAAPAGAATTTYPDGVSDFAVDAQGWTGSGATCSVPVVCTAENSHDPTAGDPPGSISTTVALAVNLAGSFSGGGTWTSPSFGVAAGEDVTGATFTYDRQLTSGGLLDLDPESTVTVRLLDDTAGTQTTLLSETLTPANASFSTRGAGVPLDAVVEGHAYRLQIQTATTSTQASVGITGETATRFDNVALSVERSDGAGGPGGGGGGGGGGGATPVVSPGVTITKGFRSLSQINALWNRLSESAEVGRLAGGSVVARRDCTIVGTARADRITGTRGNDVICGLGGNDVVNGAGGIDIVDGGNGNDRLAGAGSRDLLLGLRGNDRLNGGRGNDRLGGGAGRDRVVGSTGNDRVRGGRARDRLVAGAGRDRIHARDRTRDVVNGGKGRDRARLDLRVRGARRTKAALRRVDRVRKVEVRR